MLSPWQRHELGVKEEENCPAAVGPKWRAQGTAVQVLIPLLLIPALQLVACIVLVYCRDVPL